MKKLYLIGALLFFVTALFAQRERVVSGQLKSNEDGSPLPGVNVTIKGTTRGTVTDADGRYSISVPIGSILIYSFIGMTTREVMVSETNLKSVKGDMPIRTQRQSPKAYWNPSILSDTVNLDREGVATLDANTPTYKQSTDYFDPKDIISISRPLFAGKMNGRDYFRINTNSDYYVVKGFSIQLNSIVGFNTVGRLPELQSTFAQGRNENGSIIYRGPDQTETMSWGPAVRTLQGFNTYDPYKFYRTGISTAYEITTWFPGISGSTTMVDVSRRNNQGIIRNNEFATNHGSINMRGIRLGQFIKVDASTLFNSSDGKLMSRGSNISNINSSMMLAAPTFDPANGYGSKLAVRNNSSYQFPDCSVRSAAPGLIDNPYGLAATLPDHEKSKRLLSILGFNYNRGRTKIHLNGSYEKQESDLVFGVQPGFSSYTNGRRTERNENREDIAANFLASHNLNQRNDREHTISLGYQFRQERRDVSRTDGFGFTNENFNSIRSADSAGNFAFGQTRSIHEVLTKFDLDHYVFDVQINNRSYFSSTARDYVNLFPTLIVKSDLTRWFVLGGIDELKPFFSVSRTIRESPAIFGNQASLSTQLNSQQYNKYFENREITWNNKLSPETELKTEFGLNARHWQDISLDFSYYVNQTYGLILPVWEQGAPVLTNVGSVRNNGANVNLGYSGGSYYGRFSWGVSLRWTKYNSVVTSMDLPAPYLPLAGFNNIQTVVADGEPLGAIYGTSWQKDDEGRKIIDNDGFPLVDNNLKKIGNPIPLYLISLEPYFNFWKNVKLGFILDFRKGGQVWNGTRAALDYSGRSIETSDLRNASRYIFDGVMASGDVNTTEVDFYNPSLPLEQNRWVRYGFSGVGEEYIEDASWIRLNEVSLSYRFQPLVNGHRKQVTLSFMGKNLFLITPYSSVDPGTSLFGYSNGSGLDLFNTPSTKTYNFSVTIKL